MKTLFFIVSLLIFTSNSANADLNLSLLGSPTDYTCIVEIINGPHMIQAEVYQTCNDAEPMTAIGMLTEHSHANVIIQIIDAMRPDFTLITSYRSEDTSDSSVISLIFQKR